MSLLITILVFIVVVILMKKHVPITDQGRPRTRRTEKKRSSTQIEKSINDILFIKREMKLLLETTKPDYKNVDLMDGDRCEIKLAGGDLDALVETLKKVLGEIDVSLNIWIPGKIKTLNKILSSKTAIDRNLNPIRLPKRTLSNIQELWEPILKAFDESSDYRQETLQ